jgi:hypothetical protein
MEELLREIESETSSKKEVRNILAAVEDAITEAVEIRDQEFVDSPSLRKALQIVEAFLRKTNRICYGGMAINAHLPKSKKFYDFRKVLPDYDFFTPNPEEDVKDLVRTFQQEGFDEVSARVGMHEGTTKIFVNFTGVADITFMPPWMYKLLEKRAIRDDGIQYVDSDFLRMNMYLELSRPRGEVERWDKVYKRLVLLNSLEEAGTQRCGRKHGVKMTYVPRDIHIHLIEYLAKHGLIYLGAELQKVYETPKSIQHAHILRSTTPVMAIATLPEIHVLSIKQLLHAHDPSLKLQTVRWAALGELVPEMYGLSLNGRVIFLVVQEKFCHAYNTVKIGKGNDNELKIAALDAAITMFYTLTFVRGLEGFVPKSLQCFANELVDISRKTRDAGKPGAFPLFPVTCQGHQPSKPTLLREKAKRIAEMKQKSKTRKQTSKLKRGTTYKRSH